jgi:hypothetical protein
MNRWLNGVFVSQLLAGFLLSILLAVGLVVPGQGVEVPQTGLAGAALSPAQSSAKLAQANPVPPKPAIPKPTAVPATSKPGPATPVPATPATPGSATPVPATPVPATPVPATPVPAVAKSLLFLQERESATPQPMTTAQLAELRDPFFNLVLKNNARATTLPELTKLLNPREQQVFVVDEHIVDPAPSPGDRPAKRRAIVTYHGETNQQVLSQNVMLSVGFDPKQFPTPNFIEAMGWDETQGRFNYYKLAKSGDDPGPTWRFRGSSAGASKLSLDERKGTCMACHVTGGPVMKELELPWNNWHSFSSEATYLSKGKTSWPIVNDPKSPLANLQGAETLEGSTPVRSSPWSVPTEKPSRMPSPCSNRCLSPANSILLAARPSPPCILSPRAPRPQVALLMCP